MQVIPLRLPIPYPQWVKTILIPTDFSSAATSALQVSLPIFFHPDEACKVLLLNTFLIPATSLSQSVALHDELKAKALHNLEEERERLKRAVEPSRVDFELLACVGSLGNAVAYLSRDRKVDCVLLGAGLEGKNEEILRILNRIPCPVLIVPLKIQ